MPPHAATAFLPARHCDVYRMPRNLEGRASLTLLLLLLLLLGAAGRHFEQPPPPIIITKTGKPLARGFPVLVIIILRPHFWRMVIVNLH